jgi:antitoxin (DNA-binding transcriptional repressor) of toxin-antitoxin stability system
MIYVDVENARERFEELIGLAEAGETVAILRDGMVVASLIAAHKNDPARVRQLLDRIDELRSTMPALNQPFKKMIEEGRE